MQWRIFAELLTGHRKRSGLIKQSLCVLVPLDIKMLSTSTLFTIFTQLSQRAYCVRERSEKQKREEERKSKSDHTSGRDKWELSKDEAGVACWA